MAYLEPLIGALAAFALGFVWYTYLFGKAWQAEANVDPELAQKHMARTHGLAIVMMYIMSYAVNIMINYHDVADQTFAHGAFHAVQAGLFYAAPAIAIHYLYQQKSLKMYLIDTLYVLAFLGLSGGIMGALKL